MRVWVHLGESSFRVGVDVVSRPGLVEIDGRAVEFDLEMGPPGIYTLLVESIPYEVALVSRNGGFLAAVHGVPFDVEVEDDLQRRVSFATSDKATGEGRVPVRAPMPGRVTWVDVAKGDQVERGERLVVLEAMKMENDIKAPQTGRVETVNVRQNQVVEQGETLIVLS